MGHAISHTFGPPLTAFVLLLMVLQDFWGLTGWDGRDQESRYPQAGRELRGQRFLQEPNDFLTVQTRLLTAIRENAVSILHGHF